MKITKFIVVFLFVTSAFVVRGQIFVTNYNDNTIGKYDATTGTLLSASFLSGVTNPQGLAVFDGNLFAVNNSAGRIGKYDATTGAVINSSFIGGLGSTIGLAASDGSLFVATDFGMKKYSTTTGALSTSTTLGLSIWGLAVDGGNVFATSSGIIGKYDTSTLAPVNASFITGLTQPTGIAVFGGILYVANSGTNTIGKYDAVTGAALNASFITGGALSQPASLAITDGKLYVVNQSSHTLGVYDAATGTALNTAFITGLTQPTGMTISAIPEPSTYAVIFGLTAFGFSAYRRRKNSA